MSRISRVWYWVAALIVIIWGTTFSSTRVLLDNGLSPISIMLYRFTIAYICMWIFARERLFAASLRDELLLVAAGMTGGSLYFVTENEALTMTMVTNVSLILCTAPILTVFLNRLIFKNVRIKPQLIIGSIIALAGVVFVVYNGQNAMQVNPLGDLLTFFAALSWSIYTIVLRLLDHYTVKFVTRKVFFYGIISLIPWFVLDPLRVNPETFFTAKIIGNLLFLGIIASFLCFWIWNNVVAKLGAVRASNFLYTSPIIAVTSAYIVLDEPITWFAVAGTALTIAGVYLADRKATQ